MSIHRKASGVVARVGYGCTTSPLRKSWRLWARIGVAAIILNELRGIAVVAMSWPVWWPMLTGMFHAAMGH